MAGGEGGRRVVVIMDFGNLPEGRRVEKSRDEILRLLKNTSPSRIEEAGTAYEDAAKAIQRAVESLEEHAPRIAQVWKGPDANKARHALQMLHASGGELTTKLEMMSTALRKYGRKLAETTTEVENISVSPAEAAEQGDGGGTYGGPTRPHDVKAAQKAEEDRRAQQALYELNRHIVELTTTDVPQDVSYELPRISLPGGPPTVTSVRMPDVGHVPYTATAGDGAAGFRDASTGGGNTGPAPTGGDRSGGERVAPPAPSTESPSAEPPPAERPEDAGPAGPATGQGPDGQAPDRAGPEEGTVPPVLGAGADAGSATSSRDAPGADPDGYGGTGADDRWPEGSTATDLAAYQPQTTPTTPPVTTSPALGAPGGTLVGPPMGTPVGAAVGTPIGGTPVSAFPPYAATPGTPPVLGAPSTSGGAGDGQAATVRTAAGGALAGVPYLPMAGMGMGADGGGQDHERMTYLPAEWDDPHAGHDVTDPIIG